MIANIHITGSYPELAARLWDVAPAGTQTLTARGLYRPTGSGRVVFQLHANAWHFATGHVPKLQLLGRDSPYARPSNGTFTVTISRLDLRLPVHERPGTPQVSRPAPFVVPCRQTPAPGLAALNGCHGGFFLTTRSH